MERLKTFYQGVTLFALVLPTLILYALALALFGGTAAVEKGLPDYERR